MSAAAIAIAPEAADRLAKLCGMLGSDHDGERAAAAAKATEFLRSLGLTWRGLVEAAVAMPDEETQPEVTYPQSAAEWHEGIVALLDDPPFLHEGEAKFLLGMERQTRRGRAPTAKQAAWLRKIAKRGRR